MAEILSMCWWFEIKIYKRFTFFKLKFKIKVCCWMWVDWESKCKILFQNWHYIKSWSAAYDCNFPHMYTDYRQTLFFALCCTRQSWTSSIDRCTHEILPGTFFCHLSLTLDLRPWPTIPVTIPMPEIKVKCQTIQPGECTQTNGWKLPCTSTPCFRMLQVNKWWSIDAYLMG